jgi:biopolymer transport protein ExbD
MNRNDEEKGTRLSRSSRVLIGASIVFVLLAAVITTVSMQTSGPKNKTASPAGGAAKAPEKKTVKKELVTVSDQGELVVFNRETGSFRPLTQDETAKLAVGLKKLINNTDEGLVQVKHEDGMVSMDLQGHYQDVLLARKETDGTVTQACVDNLDSAASFFEIDPQVLGLMNRPVSAPVEKLPIK